MNGIYEAIAPAENGYFWSQSLSLYLGVHQGQLRYFQPNGDLVLTPGEYGVQSALRAESERQKAESERQKAASERQKAASERQRAETLAAQLRKLGIEPEA